MTGHLAHLAHLAKRFAFSLRPGGPGVAGEAWARRWLRSPEAGVWEGMSGPDRRHALAVARRVAARLGNADGAGVPTDVVAAALLHDAGKTQSALGTFGRSAATVYAALRGRDQARSLRVSSGSSWRRRASLYLAHDRLGAEMLASIGSAKLVVTWAGEHHLPPDSWTVDRRIGAILKAADDD